MDTATTLRELGFSANDRLAVVHADDLGMCQASLPAIAGLFESGLLTSAAVMVPCAWFPAAADFARQHPAADLGVHLTLNSEWPAMRWGPLTSPGMQSGLLDEQGYFHRRTAPTRQAADLGAVRLELDAQLLRARQMGIVPTHADTHMFALAHPRLLRVYLEAALGAGTLPILPRPGSQGWRAMGLDAYPELEPLADEFAARGLPLVDGVVGTNLQHAEGRLDEARMLFDNLPVGVTHFYLHPCLDTPELRAMAPDWACRVGDYTTFLSEELRRAVQASGVQLIGYRPLLELARQQGVLA